MEPLLASSLISLGTNILDKLFDQPQTTQHTQQPPGASFDTMLRSAEGHTSQKVLENGGPVSAADVLMIESQIRQLTAELHSDPALMEFFSGDATGQDLPTMNGSYGKLFVKDNGQIFITNNAGQQAGIDPQSEAGIKALQIHRLNTLLKNHLAPVNLTGNGAINQLQESQVPGIKAVWPLGDSQFS